MQELIQIINGLYELLGINLKANAGDVYGIGTLVFLLAVSMRQLYASTEAKQDLPDSETVQAPGLEVDKAQQIKPEELKKTPPAPKKEELDTTEHKEAIEEKTPEPSKEVKDERPVEVVVHKEPTVSWAERLKKGLSRSRSEVWGKVEKLLGRPGVSAEQLDEIEEILYTADLGPQIVGELIESLQEKFKQGPSTEQLKETLYQFLKDKMSPFQKDLSEKLFTVNKTEATMPYVIMVVGVNGAGKTTTIGKLATKLSSQGASVVVGACDTFRAAAVDQLEVWCERAKVKMVRAKEGADPSGVAYQALKEAIDTKAEYCILDTAGRLHTNKNLMEELRKGKRVLTKLDPAAPHQTLLVIDAITGQNAFRQAKEFNSALEVDGLIFTKCDGSSKGGNAVTILSELQIPIAYIGVGESVDDLNRFDLDDYLKVLLNV